MPDERSDNGPGDSSDSDDEHGYLHWQARVSLIKRKRLTNWLSFVKCPTFSNTPGHPLLQMWQILVTSSMS